MRKPTRVLRALRKRLREVLIAGFITFILYMVAFSEGLGYQVLDSSVERIIVYSSAETYAQLLIAHVKVSLNPFFFPISCVSGNGVISSDFVGYSIIHGGGPRESWSGGQYDVVVASEKAGIIVFNELFKSIPVFFTVGLFTAYLTDKLIEHIRGRKNLEELSELNLKKKDKR